MRGCSLTTPILIRSKPGCRLLLPKSRDEPVSRAAKRRVLSFHGENLVTALTLSSTLKRRREQPVRSVKNTQPTAESSSSGGFGGCAGWILKRNPAIESRLRSHLPLRLASSRSALRPSALPFTVNRRRWSSFRRMRLARFKPRGRWSSVAALSLVDGGRITPRRHRLKVAGSSWSQTGTPAVTIPARLCTYGPRMGVPCPWILHNE